VEDNNVIDFLESSATSHVVTTNPGKKRKMEDPFPVSEDGRLIINDPEQPIENTEEMVETNEQIKEYEELFEKNKEKIEKNKEKKRKSMPNSIYSKKSAQKKAGGDVRKKNAKYEPFAYLPLKAGQLNKRRRQTAHKAYKQILSKPSLTGRGIRKGR